MFETPLCMAFLGRCLIKQCDSNAACPVVVAVNVSRKHMMDQIPLSIWYLIYGGTSVGKLVCV